MTEALRFRIARLKQLVSECPPVQGNVSSQIRDIMQTAPGVLHQIETAVQKNDPLLLENIHNRLVEIETLIEWAVETVQGMATAERVKTGKHTDPSLPAEQRLLNRLTMFMLTKINRDYYPHLVREFAGDDAVEGNTIIMDPREETESFSQWMIYDVVLHGQSARLIDLFAKEQGDTLPPDEKSLLKLKQADRPSIFKVTEFPKSQGISDIAGIYTCMKLYSEWKNNQ